MPQASPTPTFAVGLCCAFGPAELLGGLFQHRPEPVVLQVRQPEGQRIGAGRVGQLVHERLAGEVVGRRGQGPIGALPQRAIGCRTQRQRFCGDVRRATRRAEPPELMLMKSQTISAPAASRPPRISISAGGPEIGPGELLFARPAHGKRAGRPPWPAGPLRSPLRPVCLPPKPPPVSGTITRTFVGGHLQRAGQLAADAEGVLRARPDGQLVVVPFGHGRPRLHRRVLDIGDFVAFVEYGFRGGKIGIGNAAASDPWAVSRKCVNSSLLEICGLVCHLAVFARASTACCGREGRWRRAADQRAFPHDRHVRQRLRGPPDRSIAASRRRTAGAGSCRRACPAGRCRRDNGARR